VLVKAGEPKDAVKLYVELKEYTKAFNFGEQHN
jgi:pentatricopeptide repeat protein